MHDGNKLVTDCHQQLVVTAKTKKNPRGKESKWSLIFTPSDKCSQTHAGEETLISILMAPGKTR